MARSSSAGNNARSNSMNPNNPAFHASVLNRSVQLNPTSALYQGPVVQDTAVPVRRGGDALTVQASPATGPGPKA
jgi:hypothetical protein